MKRAPALSLLVLLAACSAPTPPAAPAAPAVPTAPAADAMPEATSSVAAKAIGVVQSIDPASSTLVIAHEAVPALDWPPMTMPFAAPGLDLSGLKPGDSIEFEFTAAGMDGTITAIRKQP